MNAFPGGDISHRETHGPVCVVRKYKVYLGFRRTARELAFPDMGDEIRMGFFDGGLGQPDEGKVASGVGVDLVGSAERQFLSFPDDGDVGGFTGQPIGIDDAVEMRGNVGDMDVGQRLSLKGGEGVGARLMRGIHGGTQDDSLSRSFNLRGFSEESLHRCLEGRDAGGATGQEYFLDFRFLGMTSGVVMSASYDVLAGHLCLFEEVGCARLEFGARDFNRYWPMPAGSQSDMHCWTCAERANVAFDGELVEIAVHGVKLRACLRAKFLSDDPEQGVDEISFAELLDAVLVENVDGAALRIDQGGVEGDPAKVADDVLTLQGMASPVVKGGRDGFLDENGIR